MSLFLEDSERNNQGGRDCIHWKIYIGLYAYAVHNMHIHLIICICIFLFAYVFLEFPYALADLHMHFCICICIIMCICIICNVTTLVIYLIFVFPLGTLSHHPQFPPIFLSIYLLLTIEHLIILSLLFPPFHSPFCIFVFPKKFKLHNIFFHSIIQKW